MGKILAFIIFTLTSASNLLAEETCSRTAIINYQEVLVDTNSGNKGEGLRYFLEKDPNAIKYLKLYQKDNENQLTNAILGTTGTLMIFSGLVANTSKTSQQALIIGGATILAINFLIAKTLDYNNEVNLQKAIDEYNKRNLPRIYFNPYGDSGNTNRGPSSTFMIEFQRSF